MFRTRKRIEELEQEVEELEQAVSDLKMETRMLRSVLIDHKIVINEDELSWVKMLEALKDFKIT